MVYGKGEVIRILLKPFSETELSRLNTLASYNISPTRSLNISPTCLGTLYLHACQVRVTLGDAGICCCISVTYFERLLSPLCVSSIKRYGQNRLFWELATYIHTSHWTVCFGNPPKDCPQIMRSWSHSHKTAVRKPWCSPPYNHQHHHYFTGFWFCTTRLQNCYCQTPAQKTLPRSKGTEKLPSNLKLAISV